MSRTSFAAGSSRSHSLRSQFGLGVGAAPRSLAERRRHLGVPRPRAGGRQRRVHRAAERRDRAGRHLRLVAPGLRLRHVRQPRNPRRRWPRASCSRRAVATSSPTTPRRRLLAARCTPDQTYGTGITDFAASNFAGIRLVNGATVVDGVGSPNSPCREGTGFTTPGSPTTGVDHSFERDRRHAGHRQQRDRLRRPEAGQPAEVRPDRDRHGADRDRHGSELERGRRSAERERLDHVQRARHDERGRILDHVRRQRPHTFAFSGGPTTYTLDPGTDFAQADTCTVVVDNAGVEDVDGDDPPGKMAADYTFSFSTVGAEPPDLRDPGRDAHLPVRGPARLGRAGRDHGACARTASTSRTRSGTATWPRPTRSSSSARRGLPVSVGQAVLVSGRVTEFRPGGAASANLTTTEITSPPVTPGRPGSRDRARRSSARAAACRRRR